MHVVIGCETCKENGEEYEVRYGDVSEFSSWEYEEHFEDGEHEPYIVESDPEGLALDDFYDLEKAVDLVGDVVTYEWYVDGYGRLSDIPERFYGNYQSLDEFAEQSLDSMEWTVDQLLPYIDMERLTRDLTYDFNVIECSEGIVVFFK